MITVLCVSGDPSQLGLAKEVIERGGGIRAGTAATGRDALTFLAAGPCDAVIADEALPDMDGIAFLSQVRKKYRIPSILITADGAPDRGDEAAAAGADFCIPRTADPAGMYAGAARWARSAVLRGLKEVSLAESEARYHELIENANLIVLKFDRDARITFFNQYAKRFFGLSDQEMGRPLPGTTIPFTGADPVRDLQEYVRDAGSRPERYALGETEHVRKNGEHVWISWRNKPILDEKGTVTGVICFGTETTERRKAEQALFAANKKLKLLNSITRHDILNQLTILGGYIEMSRELARDAEMQRFIEQEKKCARIIRSMIKFTKDYQDIGLYRPQWQYLRNIATLIATTIDFKEVGLRLDVSGLEIYADPLFEKVVYTLLENAIRHGQKLTFIRLSYRIVPEGCIVICEDDGVGVHEDEKEKIFLREYGKHTGFGLFLAREIIGITGFSIRETGTAGKGARFEITIPPGSFRENKAA